MLTSLALIFLVGFAMASIFQKLKLPRIVGMLLTGILLGPHMLNLLQDSILSISGELRQMALIVILIKAGLSLNLNDLKKVGRPAVMMAFVPATFELLAFVIFAPNDFRNKPNRCGSDGRRSCCCFASCRCSANGHVDGRKVWDKEKYPADDFGRSFL